MNDFNTRRILAALDDFGSGILSPVVASAGAGGSGAVDGVADAECPRCGRRSRSALVAGSCGECGAAWLEEGRRSPKPGGQR